jgi:hypothetical protein
MDIKECVELVESEKIFHHPDESTCRLCLAWETIKMALLTSKSEYQYFDLVNTKTFENVSIKIGPIPVHIREMDFLIEQEFKKIEKDYMEDWVIIKVWIGQ